MKKEKQGISIILPVYNEGENIKEQVIQIQQKVKFSNEILIVYDFDGDTTVEPAKKLVKQYSNVKLVKNKYGHGIIQAVKSGFDVAKFSLCVVMPADLADNPDTINKMYLKIQSGFDIVCATRYSKGGKKIGGGFLKTLLSRIAGLSSTYLLGISTTDLTNGFKMYKRQLFRSINIESKAGWEFSMEVLIKANLMNAKITDVPTTWRERTYGTSKFKLMRWLPKYIHWYVWGVGKRLKIYR